MKSQQLLRAAGQVVVSAISRGKCAHYMLVKSRRGGWKHKGEVVPGASLDETARHLLHSMHLTSVHRLALAATDA